VDGATRQRLLERLDRLIRQRPDPGTSELLQQIRLRAEQVAVTGGSLASAPLDSCSEGPKGDPSSQREATVSSFERVRRVRRSGIALAVRW
jgi:hypothetical protein